jgi:GAF domain-containing protein
MTTALKYIASRKRPEESLGFLAHVSRALGTNEPLRGMLANVAALSVPFLADAVSIDAESGSLAQAGNQSLLRSGERSVGVPIAVRGRQVAMLRLAREMAVTRRDFGPADQALAEELARRVSFAVEIDRLTHDA